MSDGTELLKAVYADPENDGPRLVYSDWLLERDDRLGEFIALQIARKTKGKRTQSKEKALFAAEGDRWWRDHPSTKFHSFRYEDTDRGFPARFRPGWPVSDEHLLAQEREVVALVDSPGWSTVRELFLQFDLQSKGVADLLRRADLRSLEKLHDLNVAILDRIADLSLPVRYLELWVRSDRDLPKVTGLQSVDELIVDMRAGVARVMKALSPSRFVERVRSLELRGVASMVLDEALGVYADLPASLETFALNQFYGQTVTLSGARERPKLAVSLTAHQIELVIGELANLRADAVESLSVTFAEGGYFTKKNRPLLAAQMQQALARFGARATLDSGK